jgi:hypothetical protein
MALAPDVIVEAPRTLLATGAGAALLALLLWLWMLRRLLGAVFGRAQRPWSGARYLVVLLLTLALGAYGLGALMVAAALTGYRAFTERTHVAEVQCIDLAPGKLRLYYVELTPDGRRGPTRTFDLDGDEWTLGGEVLRWRPSLTALGAKPFAGVTRVEGRWSHAADANAHKPTAYDLHQDTIGTWRWLQRHGTDGPLRWMVDGVHGSAVSQQPDRRVLFDLFITPDGYVLAKREI